MKYAIHAYIKYQQGPHLPIFFLSESPTFFFVSESPKNGEDQSVITKKGIIKKHRSMYMMECITKKS